MIALASASPVRARLLREAGVDFKVVSSPIDEAAAKSELLASGLGAPAVAESLAQSKACAARVTETQLVIGADSTLELDGAMMNKAGSLDAARDHLRCLRGRAHQLHSAAALARNGEVLWVGRSSARLVVRAFSDAFLDRYLEAEGEGLLGSVGCYRLEGLGAQLFDVVEGDYFAILGLPLIALLTALRAVGELGG